LAGSISRVIVSVTDSPSTKFQGERNPLYFQMIITIPPNSFLKVASPDRGGCNK
jgi:hypothetical protein